MNPWRPEFGAALRALARASETMKRQGFPATLFGLYPAADMAYLDRRIHDETAGEHGIDTLRE